MKRGLLIVLILVGLLIITLVYAQEINETPTPQTPTIKCYSSKDCYSYVTQSPWCKDSQIACQQLPQCSNPGQTNSECSVTEECINCINIGYLGCKEGQCQKINCYKNEDCGQSFTKKYCSNSQACVYESINYCYNPGTIDSYCTGKGGTGCTPCAYGCSEGACLSGIDQTYPCGQGTDGKSCACVSTPPARPGCNYYPVYETNKCLTGYKETCESATCKDTDGGINYYVKGSLFFGEKIVATDSCGERCSIDTRICEKDGTLREESCVPDPGPNQGTMSTNIYKCPNGCQDGACIKGEKQREEVKCIFKNTKTEQKCYVAGKEWMYCSGTETCIVTNLEGYDGEKITWKSSCGGYAYTILDGNNEYAAFDCSGIVDNFCQSKQCEDGSLTKCYVDGSGYCVCTACQEIIIRPVCGNNVCEAGEGTFCKIDMVSCEAGKECKARTECRIMCQEDCKAPTEGIYAKLNEKFKLQISQPVKITDYKNIKIVFRDLLTPKCEEATTNQREVKAKLTGYAIENESQSVEIIKCPDVGPMAQLEVINPETMPEEGKKILTLKLHEAKNVYNVSISFLEYDWASKTGWFIVNGQTISCPENCKCDNKGYALECKSEEKCEEGKILCPDGACRERCIAGNLTAECSYGCFYGDKCLPIGVRVSGLYCSIKGDLPSQLEADSGCENNFECKSNVCVAGKCISSSLIEKIISWFRRLFGGDGNEEVIDCGANIECWENALKVCKPAKISQEGGSQEGGLIIEIIGLEGEKCVVKWTAKMVSGKESMICKFENYSLGTKSNIGSLEQYCKGTLTYWLTATPKIMRVGETPVLNSVVNATKLSVNPNDLRYSFTVHDPDGIGEFIIIKSDFGQVAVKAEPPCAKDFTSEFEFKPSDLPLRATVEDCGTQVIRQELNIDIQIPIA